ncbi:BMC domain-containing protein [Secundilactobacillus similis]|uniref:BMC domain-containing protein n=1 Tax=Secundilactobacillus similis TaxID=414682 RepID=UPI0006D2B813|nr:BMC domain-containing protein [Secundilactobacillus similis]
MAVESLGMIEVRGFLGAVVAADAALKAANVQLSDMPITRGGLVTVLLTGDVAAVNASVDAGVAIIEDFNCLISQHVIARMDNQTAVMAQHHCQMIQIRSRKRQNRSSINQHH